jgi:ABC-type bacteriocin/lantibiotic exporter with double-glycine peptidase domain
MVRRPHRGEDNHASGLRGTGHWGKYLWLAYHQASSGERLRLIWLTGLRIIVGLCDLLLAAAMYALFVLLQGHTSAHHFGWLPRTTLAAALATSAIVVFRSALEIISIRSVVEYIQGFYTNLLLRLTRGYTEMRWDRFVECNRSEVLNHTVNTAREASYFYHLCIELAAAMTVVAAMTCALIYQSPLAASGLVLAASVFYGVHRLFIRKGLREAAAKKEDSSRHLQRTLADMFSSGKELRTYSNQQFFYERVRTQARSMANETLRLMVLPQVAKILSDQGVVFVFLAMVVGVELRHGDVRQMLSILVFYFVLSRRLLPLISQITYMAGQMEGSFQSVLVVDQQLRECEDNVPPSLPKQLPNNGLVLELENISFRFDQNVALLRNLHLRQRVGEIVVIRGPSGSGKSSLLNLIAGVSQLATGTIRVDRDKIAYVPQEIVLLDDSIRNNLLFGMSDKSDADLMKALAAAKLDEFVAALPVGLDTRVGDNGILFSGGQRQRLGIARAILRGVTLLLLDEATSALDGQSENLILENLKRHEFAVILVTHRIYTRRFGDREFHLEAGQLIEQERSSAETPNNSAIAAVCG